MKDGIRIVFMGTPDFAVPSLKALVRDGYQILGVYTQPDRPVGRKQVLQPSPVKVAALELGLPVFQPGKVRAPEALDEFKALVPDVCVTAAYGQILPQKLLDIPKYGCLNVHASLLPRWRGAAPIQRAILAGDEESGVTLMRMVLALDAGPSLGLESVVIEDHDTFGTLHDKLAEVGARLVAELLPLYLRGELEPVPQPEDGVTYAGKIVRSDEFIDWSRPRWDVYNHIRGLTPWPGATTFYDGMPVKVWSAKLPGPNEMGFDSRDVNGTPVSDARPQSPGVVQLRPNVGVVVSCTGGWLQLTEVQSAGKRRMSAEDWFRGLKQESIHFVNEDLTP